MCAGVAARALWHSPPVPHTPEGNVVPIVCLIVLVLMSTGLILYVFKTLSAYEPIGGSCSVHSYRVENVAVTVLSDVTYFLRGR